MRKRTFPWILLAMLAAAALAMTGLSMLRGGQEPTQTTAETTLAPVALPAQFSRAGQLRYHYSQLNETERQAYDDILVRLPGFPESIKISGLTSEGLSRVFSALVLDQPLLFYISTTHYKTSTLSGMATAFIPEYRMTQAEYAAECEAIAEVCRSFTVPANGTDFERELALHDQLIRICSYSDEIELPQKSTVYGALVERSASCEGYARSMQLLLDLQGINCYIVTGEAKNLAGVSGGHAWNKVSIGGAWYHLDATWDDPVTEDGSHITSHAYFNVTDAQLNRTNEINDTNNPCTETKDNYFVRKDLLFESLDKPAEERIAKVLAETLAAGDNAVEIRFSDAGAMEEGLRYLFDKKRVYRVLDQANQNGARIETNTVYHADLTQLQVIRILPVQQ